MTNTDTTTTDARPFRERALDEEFVGNLAIALRVASLASLMSYRNHSHTGDAQLDNLFNRVPVEAYVDSAAENGVSMTGDLQKGVVLFLLAATYARYALSADRPPAQAFAERRQEPFHTAVIDKVFDVLDRTGFTDGQLLDHFDDVADDRSFNEDTWRETLYATFYLAGECIEKCGEDDMERGLTPQDMSEAIERAFAKDAAKQAASDASGTASKD